MQMKEMQIIEPPYSKRCFSIYFDVRYIMIIGAVHMHHFGFKQIMQVTECFVVLFLIFFFQGTTLQSLVVSQFVFT